MDANTQRLAEILKTSSGKIIERWEECVREEVPAAKGQQSLALKNGLPKFIEKLIEALNSPSPQQKIFEEETELAKGHGEERSKLQPYTLDQVIAEYRILREVLFNEIDPSGAMSLTHGKIIWDSIFFAIKNAASEFSLQKAKDSDFLHSELKKAHAALSDKFKDSAFNFKSIIDGVSDYAIFTLDPTGIITSWNYGAERMKRYKPEEAIGNHFSMLYPEEGRIRNEPNEHLHTAKIEGRYRGEGLRVKKDGELFMADVYILPLFEKNEVNGFAKIVQDLTERNNLIQDRNLSRTEATDLRQEKDLRESFVWTLTHDLRSPITASKISAQLILKNSSKEDKVIGWASKIIDHSTRLDNMITNLLDANRIKAGEKLPLKKNLCNLNVLATEVCDSLSTVFGDRIRVHAKDQVEGNWDGFNLFRVLENLVSNALKYSEQNSEVTVRIETSKDRALIRVHNFGSPIDVADQPTLFEQFRRTDSAKKAGPQGWGLGLALVKAIVEAHNGVITLESTPIIGTTFVVDLPINEA
jgi:PAS domain S-box-containing protein